MRPGRFPLTLCLVLAALAAACAVKPSPMRTWTLAPRQRAAPARLDPVGPTLAVRRFSAAEEIRTTDVTWRDAGGHEIKRREGHAWTDYPDRLVQELALSHAASSGLFSLVGTAPPYTSYDGVLSCRVVDFSEWAGSPREARVALRWQLTGRGMTMLAGGTVEASEPTPGGDAVPVEAFELATLRALEDIERKVVAALSSAR